MTETAPIEIPPNPPFSKGGAEGGGYPPLQKGGANAVSGGILSTRSLWSDDALRALVAWGKTFHHPWQPDVEWNIWQLALALEAHLGEPDLTPTEEPETC